MSDILRPSGHHISPAELQSTISPSIIAAALTEGARQATYNFQVPEIKMPEIKIPEIKIPEIKMPDISLPDWHPHINVPEFKIPDIQVPPLDLSQIARAVQDALGSEVIQKPFDFLIDSVKQVSGFLGQIVDFLQMVFPLIRVVMNSYNEWNSLQDRMKASGQDLASPNLDPVLAAQMTALMAVPGVGQMVRGAVNYAHMARYQQMTGRGFATDLDQLYWLANGPAGAAAGGIDQAVSRIPAFFLR